MDSPRTQSAMRSSAAMLVFISMLLSSASAAGPFVDVPSALKGMPDASTFWTACQAVGLDKDRVFVNPKWEGLIYVPTNQAFQTFFATMPQADFLSNKGRLSKYLLQHIVSSYQFNAFRMFYDGQTQASLLSNIDNRSRLHISITKAGYMLTAEKSTAYMHNDFVKAGEARLIFIDAVLVPDLDTPVVPVPRFQSPWDAINNTPGLEDFAYAVQKTSLLPLLQDTTKTFTMFVPNNYAMRWITKVLNKPAQQVFANVAFLEKVILYNMLPGVYYTAADLYSGRKLTTALTGHFITMTAYHNHIVPVGERTKGKLVEHIPRRLPSVSPNGVRGSYDIRCGKSIVHPVDAWVLPNA